MAKYKFKGPNYTYHLKDDKDKEVLVAGQVYDITVKRADEINAEKALFERVDEEEAKEIEAAAEEREEDSSVKAESE